MSITLNASTSSGFVQSADNSGEIELQSNGTTALKVNTNEGIQILNCLGVGNATPSTSGAGITFPATQSASTDGNTLDDYEEGTFNPTPEGTSVAGTVNYINRVGSYIKIGRQVTCWIHLNWNSGTGSGNLIITGLPFTTANNNNYSVAALYFDGVSITNGNIFESYVGPNGTRIDFIQYSPASSATATIAYDSAGVILASLTYIASA